MRLPIVGEKDCEKCSGRGYTENDYGAVVPCKCNLTALFPIRVRKAHIPSIFWNAQAGIEASLSKYKPETKSQREALPILKAWVNGVKTSREWVLITGNVGTGKSYLASALLIAIARKYGVSIRFITVFDFLAEIKREFNGDGPQDFDAVLIYDQLAAVDLLVLDDIGNAKASDFAVDQITNLVDARLRSKKPTILTSNLEPKALGELYGERFMSRVSGGGVVIPLNGPDRRQAVKP